MTSLEQLTATLWRWTAAHPGWKPGSSWERDVGSVATTDDGVLALIDPLIPPEGTPEATQVWRWIAEAREVRILAGNRFHERSVPEILARAGAKVSHEPPPGVAVHAIEALDGDERAFYLAAHKTLVFADAVIGIGDGAVRVAPASWSAAGAPYVERFRPTLRLLLALDIERLLPSHGAPVLSGGGRALALALELPGYLES